MRSVCYGGKIPVRCGASFHKEIDRRVWQTFASRTPQHSVCKLCRPAELKDAQISLSDASVDLTGAVRASLQTEHAVVNAPGVVAGLLTEAPAADPANRACKAGHSNDVGAASERIFIEHHGVSPRSTNVAVSLRRDEPCSTPLVSIWPVDSHEALTQSGLHRVLQTKDQRLVSTERDGYFGLCKITTEPLTVGSKIFVDLPEHGISADFTVREIRPCPTPMAGDGYLVTTKFIHENAEILDLWIEGSNDPIGTTSSHPFWSEDRQQFIAAGELRVGENLLLADDTTRRVESITLRPNRETVYNIEVDGEHVFYVGEDGVLVHNSCSKYVYVIKNAAGKTVYVGITSNLAVRKAAHRLFGTFRQGDKMYRITRKVKHDIAREIESKMLHGILKDAIATGRVKDYHQIWYQLQQAGMRNVNRGRLSERWVDPGVFQHLIPEKIVK